jgi:Flp pilus assembly pilin Flp
VNAATRRGSAERRPSFRAGLLVCAVGRRRTGRHDHGATSVEYALMISLIALVIIASVTLFGQNTIGLFNVPSSAFNP